MEADALIRHARGAAGVTQVELARRLGPPGAPPYATLRARADRVDLDGFIVAVVALDDLLAMKRTAGRPQDLIDIDALEVARLIRTERGGH